MKSDIRKLCLKFINDKARKLSFIGFDKIPIYDVISFFYDQLKNEAITMRASSMAFHFFLALLPAIIFLFSLFPYIPIDDLEIIVLENLKTFMPSNAYLLIKETVTDILNQERGGVLSISFLSTFYFAINGVRSVISSFNKKLPTFKHRNILQDYYVSFLLVLILSFFIMLAFALIIIGGNVIDQVFDLLNIIKGLNYYIIEILRWLVVFSLIYSSISILYRYGVASNKKWGFLSVGSFCATLLCIITSLLFSFYVENFSQYNKFYGSLGVIIVLMLWFYFNSLSILIGFELNTSIEENKYKRNKLIFS